ncbi:ATP-binding protein, partial [uncultured Nostoc sp.]|uniref:sensor histidine kinase n=1 Tax=uncultured Nostoc sp. TaxID=340711 RepID=UPI0035CA15B5
PQSPLRGGPESPCLFVQSSQSYQILVEDNGIGFEENYRERIFGAFERLHGRMEFEGTGMGLAICRKITERHNGTITAQSKIGQGSTFVITFRKE